MDGAGFYAIRPLAAEGHKAAQRCQLSTPIWAGARKRKLIDCLVRRGWVIAN
jgi:hypothetical protein